MFPWVCRWESCNWSLAPATTAFNWPSLTVTKLTVTFGVAGSETPAGWLTDARAFNFTAAKSRKRWQSLANVERQRTCIKQCKQLQIKCERCPLQAFWAGIAFCKGNIRD